ncbi:MAG: 30S ribosomal protein S8e [Candidatus Caldarchaeales archaeon]
MVQWHWDLHKRKPSGGRKRPYRKKRRHDRGSDPTLTLIGERKVKVKRVRGGGIKYALTSDQYANIYNSETGKTQRAKILRVVSNKANRDYERRGVITKGSIIETEIGKAIVTSRPGQDGVINAILLEREKS